MAEFLPVTRECEEFIKVEESRVNFHVRFWKNFYWYQELPKNHRFFNRVLYVYLLLLLVFEFLISLIRALTFIRLDIIIYCISYCVEAYRAVHASNNNNDE